MSRSFSSPVPLSRVGAALGLRARNRLHLSAVTNHPGATGGPRIQGGSDAARGEWGVWVQLWGRWKASILPSNMEVKDQSVTDGLKRSADGCRPAGQLCGGFARFIMAASASACVSRNSPSRQAGSFTAPT